MHFASDNTAGVHPRIAANLARHGEGHATSYGASAVDKAVERRFNEIFEREVAVFFVATGTAANSLGLAAVNRPGGVVFCHREAHIIEDECGAPQHLTGGARLQPVDGPLGRMLPGGLIREIGRFPPDFVHAGQPMAVSITQATEAGTVYATDEIAAISAVCRKAGIPLHMDGARFSNALVSLGVSPAEMTWKQGVDIVSLGATKNGCWCAEALVFFDPAMARELPFIRKRAAQLFSKTRFIAAQFEAWLDGDLWLDMARHANAMAALLADAIRNSPRARLAWEPQANEVFALLQDPLADKLRAAGAVFYDWNPPHSDHDIALPGERLVRLVTSFATTGEEVGRFAAQIN